MQKGYDTNTICKKMMDKFGCVINIKGVSNLRQYLVIRAYCGHKYFDVDTNKVNCCRRYKLHFYHSMSGHPDISVEVFYEDIPIHHLANKTRQLRGTERTKMQVRLIHERPEVLQRKIGTEIDQEFLLQHKNLQHYKTTSVYQKAAEERRHEHQHSKNVVCKKS